MITLRETIYHEKGEQKITEKPFSNKNEIIKRFKKDLPLPGWITNELSRKNRVEFEFDGKRRMIEIIEDNE